ncbi:hypothetical protein [Haloechinothrix aidingensis]|nr:hypothetical protein [Haloechinothrix aidingensis]
MRDNTPPAPDRDAFGRVVYGEPAWLRSEFDEIVSMNFPAVPADE